MKLINKTKNIILAENVTIANTVSKRIRGLLGREDFNQGEALIIKPCNSIHTCFMRFPIDVLFVDKGNKVIQAISSITPFHFTNIYFRAAFAIELPFGTIQSTSTSENDTISLE